MRFAKCQHTLVAGYHASYRNLVTGSRRLMNRKDLPVAGRSPRLIDPDLPIGHAIVRHF